QVREERRRRADHADVRAEGRGLLCPGNGIHLVDVRSVPDQPGLDGWPVYRLDGLGRIATGLVHGLGGRDSTDLATLGGVSGELHDPTGVLRRGDRYGAAVHPADLLSVHRTEVDQGHGAPQPAATAA